MTDSGKGDMIEPVARALYETYRANASGFAGLDWDQEPELSRELARKQARAAIEAMREPTASMIDAQTSVEMLSGYEGDPTADYPDAPNIWRAMIDAALDEVTP